MLDQHLPFTKICVGSRSWLCIVVRPSTCCSLDSATPLRIVLLRLSWWSATATAKPTTELWVEATWGSTILVLTEFTAAVSTLAVTSLAAWSATATTTSLAVAITTQHSSWRSVRALLLDVSLRNDLSWQVEPLAEVVQTLWGEGVVVPLPRELGLQVAARGERLASLDDLESMLVRVARKFCPGNQAMSYVEVLGVNLVVLWLVEVLLGHGDTLLEKVLVDLLAVLLWNQPAVC